MDFELIDEANMDAVSWDSDPNGDLLRQLFAPWVRGGVRRYLDNGAGEAKLARVGRRLIPLLINHGTANASGLCSPSAYYVGYARDFVNNAVRSRILAAFLNIFLRIFALLLENRKFNRVIYVNHWLLPTAPPPRYETDVMHTLTRELAHCYPGYALVLKGISEPDQHKDAEAPAGFRKLFHRQVYYFDGYDKAAAKKKSVRGTLGKLRRRQYNIARYSNSAGVDSGVSEQKHGYDSCSLSSGGNAAGLRSDMSGRLRSLYRALYIEKHSSLNPDYRAEWFGEIAPQPALNTRVLERDGVVDAFACILVLNHRSGVEMIASVGGYDASPESRKAGLYELLQGLMLQSSIDSRARLNLSSGADGFKRMRGARPVPEYEGILIAHLKFHERWRWMLLMYVYNRLAPAVYRAVDP